MISLQNLNLASIGYHIFLPMVIRAHLRRSVITQTTAIKNSLRGGGTAEERATDKDPTFFKASGRSLKIIKWQF